MRRGLEHPLHVGGILGRVLALWAIDEQRAGPRRPIEPRVVVREHEPGPDARDLQRATRSQFRRAACERGGSVAGREAIDRAGHRLDIEVGDVQGDRTWSSAICPERHARAAHAGQRDAERRLDLQSRDVAGVPDTPTLDDRALTQPTVHIFH